MRDVEAELVTALRILPAIRAAGVDIVAITDHNAGDNVAAALRAAVGSGVTVLPGMEVQTREEVHLLTLFEKMRDFVIWCDFIKQHRSPLQNDERKFGAQFVVDESDELVRIEPAMLLASTDLSVQQAAEQAGIKAQFAADFGNVAALRGDQLQHARGTQGTAPA